MFTKMLESGRGDGCYEVLALVRQLLAEPAEKVLMCGIDDPRGVGIYMIVHLSAAQISVLSTSI